VSEISETPPDKEGLSINKMLPLGVLLAAIICFFVFDLNRFLSFEAIASYRHELMTWYTQHEILTVLSFMGIYIAAVAFSLPGAVWLTLAGGFIFGAGLATLYVVFAATIGASLLFIIARYALSDYFHDKVGHSIQKMEHGFQENAFSYLMVLRLIPAFPFWLVNLVPALLGVPLRTFFIATFLGIIPGSFVYAIVGSGINELIELEERPNLSMIFEPKIMGALVGLALLSLIPVIYKKYKSKSDQDLTEGQSGDGARN
jgi:uncharacterized membrane protein YdjX (TVP38/TMEM64 family)